jgi:hypothetical protein
MSKFYSTLETEAPELHALLQEATEKTPQKALPIMPDGSHSGYRPVNLEEPIVTYGAAGPYATNAASPTNEKPLKGSSTATEPNSWDKLTKKQKEESVQNLTGEEKKLRGLTLKLLKYTPFISAQTRLNVKNDYHKKSTDKMQNILKSADAAKGSTADRSERPPREGRL